MKNHHHRLKRIETSTGPGREGDAHLLNFITDGELQEIIAECDAASQGEPHPTPEEVRAIERCTDADLAASLFDGRPELLSRCRERLALYLAETRGQSVPTWPWQWLQRRIDAGTDPA